jgi:hypothetical protein
MRTKNFKEKIKILNKLMKEIGKVVGYKINDMNTV